MNKSREKVDRSGSKELANYLKTVSQNFSNHSNSNLDETFEKERSKIPENNQRGIQLALQNLHSKIRQMDHEKKEALLRCQQLRNQERLSGQTQNVSNTRETKALNQGPRILNQTHNGPSRPAYIYPSTNEKDVTLSDLEINSQLKEKEEKMTNMAKQIQKLIPQQQRIDFQQQQILFKQQQIESQQQQQNYQRHQPQQTDQKQQQPQQQQNCHQQSQNYQKQQQTGKQHQQQKDSRSKTRVSIGPPLTNPNSIRNASNTRETKALNQGPRILNQTHNGPSRPAYIYPSTNDLKEKLNAVEIRCDQLDKSLNGMKVEFNGEQLIYLPISKLKKDSLHPFRCSDRVVSFDHDDVRMTTDEHMSKSGDNTWIARERHRLSELKIEVQEKLAVLTQQMDEEKYTLKLIGQNHTLLKEKEESMKKEAEKIRIEQREKLVAQHQQIKFQQQQIEAQQQRQNYQRKQSQRQNYQQQPPQQNNQQQHQPCSQPQQQKDSRSKTQVSIEQQLNYHQQAQQYYQQQQQRRSQPQHQQDSRSKTQVSIDPSPHKSSDNSFPEDTPISPPDVDNQDDDDLECLLSQLMLELTDLKRKNQDLQVSAERSMDKIIRELTEVRGKIEMKHEQVECVKRFQTHMLSLANLPPHPFTYNDTSSKFQFERHTH